MAIRLGRISYLNVLPIYHALEMDLIENDFEFVSGPPAILNKLMDAGQLDISSCSSIEYARNADKYYLVPDIAIGSRGPVQSVLLLSRVPVDQLEGRTILVSAETHTSAALLRVLLAELWKVKTEFVSGDATAKLESGQRPDGILAIGDEALNLRKHPDYPYQTDLGEAWREMTDLPFIFGVWIVQRESYDRASVAVRQACDALAASRHWGTDNMREVCTLAATDSTLEQDEMCSYFDGLVYDFGKHEQKGLGEFYKHLVSNGLLDKAPTLEFIPE